MGWGVLYELYLEGRTSPSATLTIDRGGAFGGPAAPSINWSAIGPQPAETVCTFADGLIELAGIAAGMEQFAAALEKIDGTA